MSPPRDSSSRAASSPNGAASSIFAFLSISIFSFPLGLTMLPLKCNLPLAMTASALIGVEQPPMSVFKKSRSIPVHKAVSASLKDWQASKASASFVLQTTIIAPCAGAGSIQSRSMDCSGRKSMRSRPAAANTAPFQLLSCTFLRRVFTLPLRFSTLWFG